MRRIYLVILIIFFPCFLTGQMIPLTDQYLNNTMAINPAFAGCHDALSALISFRKQWIGFKDAPENLILSVHSPISRDRVGLGMLVERTSMGIYNTTTFSGNYAYRMELSRGKLALGLGFSAAVYNVLWDQLDVTDPGDELLADNTDSAVLPDFSLGGYYYTSKFFIGISMPMFLSHEFNKIAGNYTIKNDFSEYTYLLTGGYYIGITPQVKILPSALLKYTPLHGPQVDLNAQVILNDRIWFGAGYRNRNTILGMLQCQLNHQLKMAYTYNFDTGKMGKYNSGSHEIVMNYVFDYVRKVVGPRNF